MKMIFCTLFDSRYLSRGMNLYFSLRRHCPSFHLYVFPFDDKAKEVMTALKLPDITVISLEELEQADQDLFSIKETRTRGEYCWTSTPSTLKYVLDRYEVDHCTYIDSDLYFFNNPEVLLHEMGDQSVLITPHRYTPEYDQSEQSGIYCVQFVTFRKNKTGYHVLNWWREACLEWCYNRHEDGKFGDQKYLDDWTERFEGIHVLEHLGGGVAPWNVQQYSFKQTPSSVSGTETTSGKAFDLVFYHFHFIRIFESGRVDLSPYKLNKDVKQLIYQPYLTEMKQVTELLQEQDADLDPNGTSKEDYGLHPLYLNVKRRLLGIYNVHKIDTL